MLSGMETNTALSVSCCWRGLGERARPGSAPRLAAAIKAQTCYFFFFPFSQTWSLNSDFTWLMEVSTNSAEPGVMRLCRKEAN